MKNSSALALCAALALAGGGCNVVKNLLSGGKAEAEAAAASASALAAAASASAAAAAAQAAAAVAVAAVPVPTAAAQAPVPDESIPTTVDFEEEAFERVTKDTLKVRLDDIAREIKEQ